MKLRRKGIVMKPSFNSSDKERMRFLWRRLVDTITFAKGRGTTKNSFYHFYKKWWEELEPIFHYFYFSREVYEDEMNWDYKYALVEIAKDYLEIRRTPTMLWIEGWLFIGRALEELLRYVDEYEYYSLISDRLDEMKYGFKGDGYIISDCDL